MHIRVLAVGERQPEWVSAACDRYALRLPSNWQFRVSAVAAGGGRSGTDASTAESRAILAAVRDAERVIALDERGRQRTSIEVAEWLADWQADGRDVCLLIGGADGLAADCLDRAEARWSLSRLTLPHGLARVVVVEQLYRAWSLLAGHPYHRA